MYSPAPRQSILKGSANLTSNIRRPRHMLADTPKLRRALLWLIPFSAACSTISGTKDVAVAAGGTASVGGAASAGETGGQAAGASAGHMSVSGGEASGGGAGAHSAGDGGSGLGVADDGKAGDPGSGDGGAGDGGAGACVSEQTWCEGQEVRRCAANGNSSTVDRTCTDQTCLVTSGDADCQGVCSPNQRRCAVDGLQSCVSGQWNAGIACDATTPYCYSGTCNESPAPAS